jgi:hypothetical protein
MNLRLYGSARRPSAVVRARRGAVRSPSHRPFLLANQPFAGLSCETARLEIGSFKKAPSIAHRPSLLASGLMIGYGTDLAASG